MKFPSEERFLQYCISKRRTYLRQLFERKNPRGFYDLWQGELVVSGTRFEVKGIPRARCRRLGRELRWLLLQDLHRVVRKVVPEFPPAPPSVLAGLPGAMNQVRVARSMLIAGEAGVGKEQLAILLHVLSGRPGALVRVGASELGREGGTPTRQLMPERGSVVIRDLETLRPRAQEELLTFLNGDARRRNLLFFFATKAEPRELITRHGIRRDLFVRVSQTEVRLPSIETETESMPEFIADIAYDLVRISPEELAILREKAEELAASWQRGGTIPVPAGYDFVSEALSYILWDERRRRATAVLGPDLERNLEGMVTSENFRGVSALVGAELDRIQRVEQEGRGPASGHPDRSVQEGENADSVPTQLDVDSLLRAYYTAVLLEVDGDVGQVALRAGRPLVAVHNELIRLGLRPEPRSATRS